MTHGYCVGTASWNRNKASFRVTLQICVHNRMIVSKHKTRYKGARALVAFVLGRIFAILLSRKSIQIEEATVLMVVISDWWHFFFKFPSFLKIHFSFLSFP